MLTEKEIDLFEAYATHPPLYIEEVLGTDTLEDYQVKVLDAIAKYDKVAIKACHSVGKTWKLARAALWFFNMFKNSIVITTAPTHRQVKTLLWGEIRDAHTNSKVALGGRLLDTELKLNDKHYMMGFSPQKKAGTGDKGQQGSSFQGFHSDYVFVIFDEATGVDPDVWTMADGLLTSGKTVKFVAIANPTTRNCKFFECFSDPSWHKVSISCFDSPNMIANGFTDKEKLQEEIDRLSCLSDQVRVTHIQEYEKPVPYLLTAQFVVPYVMKHGFDHPLVLSKVFGEFPLNDDEVLVQYEDVFAAQQREVKRDMLSLRTIGVDVARGGGDKTVITDLEGCKHMGTDTYNKRDLMYISGLVILKINEQVGRPTVVCIDATGLGSGVLDKLLEAQREGVISSAVRIVEIHFGSKTMNIGADLPGASKSLKDQEKREKKTFANLKAKMFNLLASDLKNNLDLSEESIYLEELPTIKYTIDGSGKIVIESKKDYKTRTGKSSPDSSDSLALANFGRHIEVKAGTFFKNENTAPIVKQEKRKQRSPGIKAREY